MSFGSEVRMMAPRLAAMVTTVASTMSEVPALPQRMPAALAVSRPTGTTRHPARNLPSLKAGIRFDPARGLVALRAWAQEWLERQAIGESTRRHSQGFIS